MDVSKNIAVVASVNEISVVQDNKIANVIKVKFEPSCVSISPSGHVAVGGAEDYKVHVYELDGTTLNPKVELKHSEAVTDVAYSPDGKYLVACDAKRKVVLYNTEEYKVSNVTEWGFHNAKVNCVAWSPDSLCIASGSLDTSIIIWSVEKQDKHLIIKNAHAQSQVTRLCFLNNDTLVSVGQDCNTKLWNITRF